MSAKSILDIKNQNTKIDQQTTNSAENPFRTTTPNTMSKQEKKGNKFSRMLQAAYIKHQRRSK